MRTKFTEEQVTTTTTVTPAGERPLTLDELEAEHISDVLEMTGGNKNRAAKLLGIDRRTLYRKLAEYERKANQTRAEAS